METKGLLIAVVVIVALAGGLFLAYRLVNPGDSGDAPTATAPPRDEVPDAPQTPADPGPAGPTDATGPSDTGPTGPAPSDGDEPAPPTTAAVPRLRDKPAPGTGAESSGPRDQRLEHLTSTVSGEEVAQAVRALETSSDPGQLEKAMVTLVRDRDKANKEFFIAMLRDESEDPVLRAQAATGLGQIGAREAMPDLVEAMDDEPLILRARAGAALRRLSGFDFGYKADAPLEERLAAIANIRKATPGLR